MQKNADGQTVPVTKRENNQDVPVYIDANSVTPEQLGLMKKHATKINKQYYKKIPK